jgi:CRP-like cAMP-binding protein
MAVGLTLEQIINFLLDAPMFGDLDAQELSQIVHIMQIKTFEPDEYVFREGEPGDAWYLVYEGEVEVSKLNGGEERVIAALSRRACFGEMAILDGHPRSATVRACTDLTLLRFPRVAFHELLMRSTVAAYKLVHQMALVLVSRQRQTTVRLVELLGQEQDASVREGIAPLVEQSSVTE